MLSTLDLRGVRSSIARRFTSRRIPASEGTRERELGLHTYYVGWRHDAIGSPFNPESVDFRHVKLIGKAASISVMYSDTPDSTADKDIPELRLEVSGVDVLLPNSSNSSCRFSGKRTDDVHCASTDAPESEELSIWHY